MRELGIAQSGAASRLALHRKILLLANVWATTVRVQIALRRHPLADAVRVLSSPVDGAPVSTRQLSRAVSRGLRIGPWRPRCLISSLVLYRLLRAQGEAAELVIGLPVHATTSDAHAWVELAGCDVGPAPGGHGYVELTRYPVATPDPEN